MFITFVEKWLVVKRDHLQTFSFVSLQKIT